jgi:hypothetical protein
MRDPFCFGGERGIRTLDELSTHTPLAGERLRPLGHLSVQHSVRQKLQNSKLVGVLRTLNPIQGIVLNRDTKGEQNNGALGGSRTPDLLVRSQALYPTELPARDEGRIIRMRPYVVNLESRFYLLEVPFLFDLAGLCANPIFARASSRFRYTQSLIPAASATDVSSRDIPKVRSSGA